MSGTFARPRARPPGRPIHARTISRLDYWLSGFFLLAAMQAFGFIDRMVYGTWDGKGGDKITSALNMLLILSSLVLFGRMYRIRKTIGMGGTLALGAIAFLFANSLWSIDPASTIREAIVYLFVVIGAIGVAGILDADTLMDLLGLTCFLSAAASIILVFIAPSVTFATTDYIGIFSHKNFLGQVMATGALGSLHCIRVGRSRARNMLFLLVFGGMAFASKSATSWLTIFACCSVDGVIALWRKGGAARTLGLALTLLLVPSLIFAAVDPDPILEMIGKDPSLTGRTEIWAFVMSDISLKPLLGWGYFAFWEVTNPAAVEISNTVHWMVPQAHNGLLEMLLTIGTVGTALFVFLLARNVYLAIRCLRTSEQALGISTILCCGGILLVGISENVLLAPTQSSTSVFFITGLMCDHAVRSAKRRRYPVAGLTGYARTGPRYRGPNVQAE
jgi:O-antigen ligase